MKLLNDLFKRSKALCGQLLSSMFDSNNPVTAVDQLFESTGKTSSVFEENKALEKNTPLSDVPNIDYYMDYKGVRGENDEKKIGKEERAEYIQEEKNNKDDLIKNLPNLLFAYLNTYILQDQTARLTEWAYMSQELMRVES